MSDLMKDAESVASVATNLAAVPSAFERFAVLGLACIAACGISFGAGYFTRMHQDEVKAAAVTATVKTAEVAASAVVATADTKTDATLQKRLNAAQSRASALEQQIEAAKNANPPAPACALPDSLRNALSADLAGRARQVQNAVPGQGS